MGIVDLREYTDDHKVAGSCTIRSHRMSQHRPRNPGYTQDRTGRALVVGGGWARGLREATKYCVYADWLSCAQNAGFGGGGAECRLLFFICLVRVPPQTCRQFYTLGTLFSGVASGFRGSKMQAKPMKFRFLGLGSQRISEDLRSSKDLKGSQMISKDRKGSQRISKDLYGFLRISNYLKGSHRISKDLKGSQRISKALQ